MAENTFYKVLTPSDLEKSARAEYDQAVEAGVNIKALINGHLLMAGYMGGFLEEDTDG